jgi:hypothetical protein
VTAATGGASGRGSGDRPGQAMRRGGSRSWAAVDGVAEGSGGAVDSPERGPEEVPPGNPRRWRRRRDWKRLLMRAVPLKAQVSEPRDSLSDPCWSP